MATVNRLLRARMLRSVKEQEDLRERLEAAEELRRLATQLPFGARESRKLFLEAARSLERRQ